jgi:magnesium chelatase accessory protein
MGSGKRLLLIHGTGASSHSWADLMNELRGDYELLAVDLPGHGFSEIAEGDGMSLPGMAARLGGLLRTLDYSPDIAVGHSAGAAILARMCLDELIAPELLVSINGALLAIPGLTGLFFSSSARLLAAIPAVPSWVSSFGGRQAFTRRLIHGTGSTLPGPDVECYRYLVGNPDHVAAALKMMANWNLEALEADLPRLRLPVYLLACNEDRTVPSDHARRLEGLLPQARAITLPGLGHLGHEEDPARFARLLRELADSPREAR